MNDLCRSVLFNYEWLHAKISAVPIDKVLEDFELAIRVLSSSQPRGDNGSQNEMDNPLESYELLRQVL